MTPMDSVMPTGSPRSPGAAHPIERLDPGLFDWQTWRAGSPADVFEILCRTANLIAAAGALRACGVGWCEGSSTPCRPRSGNVAVMFFKDDRHFWFHLRDAEARAIFPEIFAGRQGGG